MVGGQIAALTDGGDSQERPGVLGDVDPDKAAHNDHGRGQPDANVAAVLVPDVAESQSAHHAARRPGGINVGHVVCLVAYPVHGRYQGGPKVTRVVVIALQAIAHLEEGRYEPN